MSHHVVLQIEGLGADGGGTLTVERALSRAPGVSRVYVSPPTEMVYVEYDPNATSPEELSAVIAGVGLGPALRRQAETVSGR